MLSNFVLPSTLLRTCFASFVVKILFRIWLRLCRAGLIVRAIHTNGHAAVTMLATRDSPPLAEYLDGERNCSQRTNANQRPPNRLALLGTKLVGKQERDARPKKSTCYGDQTDFW